MSTRLAKSPVKRVSSTLRQGRALVVSLNANDTITIRQLGLRVGFSLPIGQVFDLAVKNQAAHRMSLKNQLSKARKNKDHVRVLELKERLAKLDKGE